jgi:hypothetical protein
MQTAEGRGRALVSAYAPLRPYGSASVTVGWLWDLGTPTDVEPRTASHTIPAPNHAGKDCFVSVCLLQGVPAVTEP